jgi:hypothetical protein
MPCLGAPVRDSAPSVGEVESPRGPSCRLSLGESAGLMTERAESDANLATPYTGCSTNCRDDWDRNLGWHCKDIPLGSFNAEWGRSCPG